MSGGKQWAPEWKTTYGPQRECKRDVYWAGFEDDSNNTVRVRITAQELKEFGKAPDALEERCEHTEHVLRAILESYVREHGIPAGQIDARDLGEHLPALRGKFAKQ